MIPRYLALALLMLSACSSNRMIETSLYFGQTKAGGGFVSEQEWKQFKNDYVNKVFPKGDTSIPVTGNWRDPDKGEIITESTFIVVYLHKPSVRLSRRIDSLRYQYRKLFDQQSVLRVDKKVKASF